MLKQRVITALLLLPIVFSALFVMPLDSFALFGALLMAGCAWEWSRLIGLQQPLLRALYLLSVFGLIVAVYLGADLLWTWPAAALSDNLPKWVLMIGAGFWPLVALPIVVCYPRSGALLASHPLVGALIGWSLFTSTWVALVCLRANDILSDSLRGGLLLLLMLVIIWAADIGAYFVGKAFGQHKLAPQVSPGKTVEGFVGGLIAASLVGWFGAKALGLQGGADWQLAVLVLATALVSVLGDLLESLIKRQAGAKDSGTLLPGHGGLLDRLDSLLAAAPVFALLFLCFRFD